jgi:hypothetical protein
MKHTIWYKFEHNADGDYSQWGTCSDDELEIVLANCARILFSNHKYPDDWERQENRLFLKSQPGSPTALITYWNDDLQEKQLIAYRNK